MEVLTWHLYPLVSQSGGHLLILGYTFFTFNITEISTSFNKYNKAFIKIVFKKRKSNSHLRSLLSGCILPEQLV